MAYDEALADRIRDQLEGERSIGEQRMFGGLAFLVDGNMAVAASGKGGLLVRVDPAESEQLCRATGVEPMVMRGAPMRGWLYVDSDELTADDALTAWVQRGTTFARSLPPKRP